MYGQVFEPPFAGVRWMRIHAELAALLLCTPPFPSDVALGIRLADMLALTTEIQGLEYEVEEPYWGTSRPPTDRHPEAPVRNKQKVSNTNATPVAARWSCAVTPGPCCHPVSLDDSFACAYVGNLVRLRDALAKSTIPQEAFEGACAGGQADVLM